MAIDYYVTNFQKLYQRTAVVPEKADRSETGIEEVRKEIGEGWGLERTEKAQVP